MLLITFHRGRYMLQVQKALEAEGFYPDQIIADGKIHRFKKDSSDKGKSAWSICHQNHSDKGEVFYVAIWGDWHNPDQEFKFITSFTQTKYDRKKIEDQLEKAEKARKIEQERAWLATSEECTKKWEELSTDLKETEYSKRKKLSSLFGCKTQFDGHGRPIYVPVMDINGKIWGLQKIQDDGQKFFIPGTKKSGNFYVVGGDLKNEEIIYIAEGFATACSISMALGKPCVAAFDAGNLAPVAKVLRSKFKEARFVICGDDDTETDGNPGRTAAEKAAKDVLGKAVFPKFSRN
jgi:putative DNA primase/helicase